MLKKINKVLSVFKREIIKKIEPFNVLLYMKLYKRYLSEIGVILKNGGPRYIHPSVQFDGRDYKKTTIGSDVIISRNVLFLCHDYSISCGLRSVGVDAYENEAYFLKEIIIGNNVFIGANSILLPGTIIGDNCIVGAGTVVKGKIEPNSIIIGNPSRKLSNLDEWTKKQIKNEEYLWKKYGQ